MCRNQLGRRNITDEQKTVLIGEAYKAQKKSVGNHADRGEDGKYLRSKLDHRYGSKTGGEIAKKFGVGYGTVLRAEHYVDGLNAAEEVSPGIKEAVLSGTVKTPKQMIAETATKTETVTEKPQPAANGKGQQETTSEAANRLQRKGSKRQETASYNRKKQAFNIW